MGKWRVKLVTGLKSRINGLLGRIAGVVATSSSFVGSSDFFLPFLFSRRRCWGGGAAPAAWAQERDKEREGEEEQEAGEDQEVPERERRPRFGGPDQVENQPEEDAASKEPLVQFDFLKPYLDFKKRLKERSGFSFGVDYTAVYLRATESIGEDEAASGMVRLFGAWEFVGRGSPNTGALVYKVEQRHRYTSIALGSCRRTLGELRHHSVCSSSILSLTMA